MEDKQSNEIHKIPVKVENNFTMEENLDNSVSNISINDVSISNTNSIEQINNAFSMKSKAVKPHKKDDCSVQHVLRALNSLTTSEEKLAAMCKKYADLFDENRKLQSSLKQFQKQLSTVSKEKDQLQTDLTKSVLTRSKLESLCRELQRQNKIIKEESLQKIREEEEKRKEVSAKFQSTLNEITELMKQDSDKTMKLRDDNIDMTSKLKSIYEQFEIREQQITKMAKQMSLESQLYETKLAKLEMETSAEKETLLREKQQLLMTLTEYQTRFQEYQNIEMALRNQVTLYNNKYEEFEKSLTRSNKMFSNFKEEMETMSTKIVKLESETETWKRRWEKTQKALLEMASQKQKSDEEVIVAAKQISTLHKLCRTLQTERSQLLETIKKNSVSTDYSITTNSQLLENTTYAEEDDVNYNKMNKSAENPALNNTASNNQISKNSKKKNITNSKVWDKSNEKSSITTKDNSKIIIEESDVLKNNKCTKSKNKTAKKHNESKPDQKAQNNLNKTTELHALKTSLKTPEYLSEDNTNKNNNNDTESLSIPNKTNNEFNTDINSLEENTANDKSEIIVQNDQKYC